jgi:hypothetical protein
VYPGLAGCGVDSYTGPADFGWSLQWVSQVSHVILPVLCALYVLAGAAARCGYNASR